MYPKPLCAHALAHAQCELNSFLLYSSVECMFYCKFDGSYYDKVIWTGLCSCTLMKRVWVLDSLVSHHLANHCHSFKGIQASHIAVVSYTCQHNYLGSGGERGSFLTDRLQREAFRAIASVAWTGFWGGQRTGQLLRDGQDGERGEGQAWTKTSVQ